MQAGTYMSPMSRPPTPIGRKAYPSPVPFNATVSTICPPPCPPPRLRASRWFVVVGFAFFAVIVASMCVDVIDQITQLHVQHHMGVLVFNYVFLCVLSLGVFIVFTRLCRSVSVSANVRAALLGGVVSFLLNLSIRNILRLSCTHLSLIHARVPEFTYIVILAMAQECVKVFGVFSFTVIANIKRPIQFPIVAASVGFGFAILEHVELFKKEIFEDKRVVEGVIRALLCIHPILTSLAAARSAYPHFIIHKTGIHARDVVEGLVLPCIFHVAMAIADHIRGEYLWYGAGVLTAVYLVAVASLLGNVKSLRT